MFKTIRTLFCNDTPPTEEQQPLHIQQPKSEVLPTRTEQSATEEIPVSIGGGPSQLYRFEGKKVSCIKPKLKLTFSKAIEQINKLNGFFRTTDTSQISDYSSIIAIRYRPKFDLISYCQARELSEFYDFIINNTLTIVPFSNLSIKAKSAEYAILQSDNSRHFDLIGSLLLAVESNTLVITLSLQGKAGQTLSEIMFQKFIRSMQTNNIAEILSLSSQKTHRLVST